MWDGHRIARLIPNYISEREKPYAQRPSRLAMPIAADDYGSPSSIRSHAGVFVSQLDIMHDPKKPWLPCPLDASGRDPAIPYVWCWWLGDRIPGSIINRQQVVQAHASKRRVRVRAHRRKVCRCICLL